MKTKTVIAIRPLKSVIQGKKMRLLVVNVNNSFIQGSTHTYIHTYILYLLTQVKLRQHKADVDLQINRKLTN